MKILGIVGSSRKRGNTATLVEKALSAARSEGLETEIVYLGDHDIRGCTGCEGCRNTYKCVIQDDMQQLYPKILEADGLIAGSPTYFYNMTTHMKAFLERLYCYEVFHDSDRSVWMSVAEAMGGKFAATITVCEQHNPGDMGVTSQAMDLSLASLGYRVVDSVKVLELYEAGAARKCETALEQSRNAGRKLARTLLLKEKIRNNINM